MDVKSAFLYGTIDDEVYVTQPPGFVDPKFPNKVYKVVKALYGLHQASRAWYATLSTFLEKSRYRRGAIDKTLFIKQDKKDIMLVQVYVDDIIFGSTKKSWCDEFEELMKNRFQMSFMAVQTRSKVQNNSETHALVSYIQKQQRNNHKNFQHCLFACFLSQVEPIKISQALEDKTWVDAMQEELLQFHIQKVCVLVDLPFRKKAIGTKWVYRNKKDEMRVVVRNKARLVAQGHRQKEGIDYDEAFAHVARIEAIRIFLAFGSYMGFIVYQMDVKSAFLYGTIDDEVYVTQPPGFVDPKFPNKVYKVVKALYGLHQASRAWYATLSTFLEKSRYRRGAIDKTLFIKQDKKDIMLVQVYPLVKDEKAADVDVHLYRFQVTPKTSHLQDVKRIFRYLKGQPKLGLWYPKASSFDLKAYPDSDYAGANLDRKSTTGESSTSRAMAQSPEHGENLVRSKIKVWWPANKSYYKGVVESFDRSKMKHKVLYDDGDEDVISLKDRQWMLLENVSAIEHAPDSEQALPIKISSPQAPTIKDLSTNALPKKVSSSQTPPKEDSSTQAPPEKVPSTQVTALLTLVHRLPGMLDSSPSTTQSQVVVGYVCNPKSQQQTPTRSTKDNGSGKLDPPLEMILGTLEVTGGTDWLSVGTCELTVGTLVSTVELEASSNESLVETFELTVGFEFKSLH
nr:putative ribonuclease H-like domain-containing protein [Tanacetum cinerariifolium]